MTILLDDRPLSLDGLGGDATVADAVELAKTHLEGTGAVIVGLREDDREVPTDCITQLLHEPLDRFERLQLVTGRPEAVVLETLKQVRTAFADTFGDVLETADHLVAGRMAEAMQMLGRCAAVWASTHESIVQGGLLLRLDFDQLRIDGRPIIEWLGELAEKLRELKGAVEAHDHVLLGDILRYEWDEALQRWERMLDGFIAHVERLGPGRLP